MQIQAWINAATEYKKNGKIDKCPICGTTDSVDVKVTNFGRESFTFICKACKASVHIDGKRTE